MTTKITIFAAAGIIARVCLFGKADDNEVAVQDKPLLLEQFVKPGDNPLDCYISDITSLAVDEVTEEQMNELLAAKEELRVKAWNEANPEQQVGTTNEDAGQAEAPKNAEEVPGQNAMPGSDSEANQQAHQDGGSVAGAGDSQGSQDTTATATTNTAE